MRNSSPSSGMATYSARQGRRFALTLAAAFAVFAAVAYWRRSEATASVTGALAGAFLVAAAIAPSHLAPIERGWMWVAHAISRVTTPIFLGLVYFVVLTPAGMLRRTIGRNPLVRQAGENGYWSPHARMDPEVRRRRMERQF